MVSIVNAVREQREKFPKVDGVQYKAVEVAVIDDRCTGCAASDVGKINTALCNKFPSCVKWDRLDSKNVVFQEVGKANQEGGGK